MGKKRRRYMKQKKELQMFKCETAEVQFTDIMRSSSAKDHSKLSKKMRKRARQQMLQIEKMKSKDKIKNTSGWHLVTVEVNTDIEKQFLLSSISNYVDTPFIALGFHRLGKNICFYLESNKEVAEAIVGLDRRIQSPNGEAMRIKISAIEIPELVLNAYQLQVLQEVIINRFNSSSGLLDLSCLHLDPHLLEKDIFVPLNSPLIMKQVLRIIREDIINLKALNMSKNKLAIESIKCLQSLHTDSCHLLALNLEGNNLCSLKFIKYISMFPLQELQFSSNPVQETITNPVQHLKVLTKELPKLRMVDGFDIDSRKNNSVQPAQSTLTTSSQIPLDERSNLTEDHLRSYLDQFYKLIDTAERTNLWAAYTPNAKFELQSFNPVLTNRLHEGQQEIQLFYASLPETKHVHTSFSLEIINLSPYEGCVKVCGICYISGFPDPVSFERMMKIVPFNSGFCCTFESLLIR